jgi:hypothetical protein
VAVRDARRTVVPSEPSERLERRVEVAFVEGRSNLGWECTGSQIVVDRDSLET